MDRQVLGRWGEQLAANYLLERGYEIIDHNVHTAYGELDLIARLGEVLVFVEVRTRTTSEYGLPEESITRQKATHLLKSAQAYILTNDLPELDWRIDLIGINKVKGKQPIVTHIENAIH